MNIEQIAKEARLSMLRDFNGLSKEINICVNDDTEFLRRCLSKLAEQDVGRANWKPLPEDQNERITFDRALHNIYDGDARLAVAIEVAKLYTETQLLAAQQRTAEACAKAVERLISGDGICADNEVWIHDCADAIRRGDWSEYL